MTIFGTCKTCGGVTQNYACVVCDGRHTGVAKKILEDLADIEPGAECPFCGRCLCDDCVTQKGSGHTHDPECVWARANKFLEELRS